MDNVYSASRANLVETTGVFETYEAKMLQLNGRIGRLRFITYCLSCILLINFCMLMLGLLLFSSNTKLGAFIIFLAIPMNIACLIIFGIRRLNDVNHSGWLSLILFLPLLNILLILYLLIASGSVNSNDYGPVPDPTNPIVSIGSITLPIIFLLIVATIGFQVNKNNQIKSKVTQSP